MTTKRSEAEEWLRLTQGGVNSEILSPIYDVLRALREIDPHSEGPAGTGISLISRKFTKLESAAYYSTYLAGRDEISRLTVTDAFCYEDRSLLGDLARALTPVFPLLQKEYQDRAIRSLTTLVNNSGLDTDNLDPTLAALVRSGSITAGQAAAMAPGTLVDRVGKALVRPAGGGDVEPAPRDMTRTSVVSTSPGSGAAKAES